MSWKREIVFSCDNPDDCFATLTIGAPSRNQSIGAYPARRKASQKGWQFTQTGGDRCPEHHTETKR